VVSWRWQHNCICWFGFAAGGTSAGRPSCCDTNSRVGSVLWSPASP
jgi:hypothetical protein